ncbi:hypothetical protein F5146DRAFT_1226084 [Armillaria mellea]|nr:hypothetical protein F5146DRAFT_1226084 [Armillaria mellea]
MPPSRPPRTLNKASRTRKTYKRGSGRVPPVMLAPEVEHVPDDETYPGGGLLIRYKDTEGYLHKENFTPNDWVAFGMKCASTVIKSLYGDVVADSVDYKSLVEGNGGPIAFTPPDASDRRLYRIFEFSPTLWIRVWDPGFPILPGETRDLFGVDMVDVCGRPQAVNTRVKVIAGARPAIIAPERQGDIIAALDDIGVRMDRFDLMPSRYPISADLEYIFEDGQHKVVHSFHHNLLDEPASERLARWTRTNTGLGRSRSAD